MKSPEDIKHLDEISEHVAEIPAFKKGLLPPGLHEACFEDVIERFGTNRTRRALCQKLEKFLLTVIDSNNFSYAYIGGEFATSNPLPSDIEVVLQTKVRTGPYAFLAIERLCGKGLGDIYKKYSLRLSFWVEDSFDEMDTASNFFANSLSDLESIVPTLSQDKRALLKIRL